MHDAINLGQGYPDFPAPEEVKEAARARDRRGPQPVPDHVGCAGVPRGDRGDSTRRDYGMDGRPETEICVTCGRTGGDGRACLGDARCGRRGRRLRAVLRELRARRDPVGRVAAVRDAARARLVVRPGRAARGVRVRGRARSSINSPHNPTGKVFTARRARSTIAELCLRARRDRDHRRDLRAHHVRRREHIPIATLPGMRERTGHDQRAVEDVLGHRAGASGGRSRRRR